MPKTPTVPRMLRTNHGALYPLVEYGHDCFRGGVIQGDSPLDHMALCLVCGTVWSELAPGYWVRDDA